MSVPEIALIAAVAENGVLGRNGDLPWHLPGDMRYFMHTTLGKPVVMGRKTWDSIGGRPLPGRTNIVLSRQVGLPCPGALLAPDFDSALELAAAQTEGGNGGGSKGGGEIMVAGGAAIYALALPRAARLYLTEVHAYFEGDARFPDWDKRAWKEVRRERHRASPGESCDYSFVVYERG